MGIVISEAEVCGVVVTSCNGCVVISIAIGGVVSIVWGVIGDVVSVSMGWDVVSDVGRGVRVALGTVYRER